MSHARIDEADVVLALFLQGNRFTADEKRHDFEYYDPITTGDSTLSAVVQSIVAAEVGYHEVAHAYFVDALYVDLANAHANTVDGLHIASTGGVWCALANGFGGMRDHGGQLSFDPRLPADWRSLTYRLTWRGTRLVVDLTPTGLRLRSVEGEQPVPVSVAGLIVVMRLLAVDTQARARHRLAPRLGDRCVALLALHAARPARQPAACTLDRVLHRCIDLVLHRAVAGPSGRHGLLLIQSISS